ncbi:MAG: aminodeoxychorismate lyase [Gallionella sp.]
MLVNGKPSDLINIRDRGLLYGDGVFRTLRASGGQAFHWPLHYKKLRQDCATLGIICPDPELLSAELNGLLELHPVGVIKLVVTRGEGARGYAPPALVEPTHLWDVSPLPCNPADWATNGIKARLCRLRLSQQPLLAGIKHLNRLENVLAASELSDSDAAEGLLMDAAGNVIGGTRSNLFVVTQGKLITPELTQCGVAGVQRDRVMAWAKQHHMPLQVRDVGLDEILHADELFVVNSIMILWPLRKLEKSRWTRFPVAMKIRQSLEGADA